MFVSGKNSKDSDILRRMILKTNFSEHWYELSSHQSLAEAFPEYELFYDLVQGEWIDADVAIERLCKGNRLPYVEAFQLFE